MSFFAWILLGLLAGSIATKIVNRKGSGLEFDILLGVVGAALGGWLFSAPRLRWSKWREPAQPTGIREWSYRGLACLSHDPAGSLTHG